MLQFESIYFSNPCKASAVYGIYLRCCEMVVDKLKKNSRTYLILCLKLINRILVNGLYFLFA